MKIFICIDDRGGLLFNNRRSSRDRVLIEDMARDVGEKTLFISPFSEKLLENSGMRLKVFQNFLDKADNDDVCFVENVHIMPYIDKISELVIYKWNRLYPSDFKIDCDPIKCGFKLLSVSEFAGSSHEKITKEIYGK